ncbi:MAG: hypothetical protein L7G91_04840 [Acidilobus sp.]|nr:hypothetical protein [Acidilobus sp.]MCG2890080.1 hypothetical protein [Acidilobus sp.]MCG2891492.1 hypothetical protein [Acidilobus sp.]
MSAQEGGGGQEKEEKGKVYTIRGLDPELYERFSRTAKELGVTVGDLMNMAMSNLLVTLEASKDVGQRVSSVLSRILDKIKEAQAAAMRTVVGAVADFDLISDIDELTVTKADLQAAERPIVFSNIKRLVFAPDVDWETLNSKVRSIKVVNELVVPKGVPVLQLARKCQLVKRIVVQ